jgi:hypothetical protein
MNGSLWAVAKMLAKFTLWSDVEKCFMSVVYDKIR